MGSIGLLMQNVCVDKYVYRAMVLINCRPTRVGELKADFIDSLLQGKVFPRAQSVWRLGYTRGAGLSHGL